MMFYFGNRRPRGFRHHYIYVDERKDRMQMQPQEEEGRRRQSLVWRLGALLLLVLLLLAACVFVMALR